MPRGEKNKLDKYDIQEIIELKGILQAHKVALQFSISPAMVYKIWEDISYYKDKYGLLHQLDLNILQKMMITLQDRDITFPFTPREIERYSQLQKQAIDQQDLNDIYPLSKLSIIFFGMAGSGKTSILQALRGEDPKNILEYPPPETLEFEKSLLSIQGENHEVFDVSGLVPFLQRVMEGNPEYLFRRGRIIVFIIDSHNMDQLVLSKFYLEQAVNNITYFIPNDNLPLGVFLHKVDLLPEDKKEARFTRIKNFLTKTIAYPIKFYETSLHDVSTVKNAFSDIIQ
jgi:GTPase SAR1 family protein